MDKFLIFDENEHRYSILGNWEIEVPSVTQLLKFGNIVDYDFLDISYANIGTEIHKMTELMDEGLYPRDLAEGRVQASMLAYEAFLEDHEVVWEDSEKQFFSERGFYAGTIDRIGTVDGKRMIVDIKSGSKVRWHALQLAGYADGEDLPLASLYLAGFDYRFHIWSAKDVALAKSVFESLLEVYWYTRPRDYGRLEKLRDEVNTND